MSDVSMPKMLFLSKMNRFVTVPIARIERSQSVGAEAARRDRTSRKSEQKEPLGHN